jgi:hypothetical protein
MPGLAMAIEEEGESGTGENKRKARGPASRMLLNSQSYPTVTFFAACLETEAFT